MNPIAIALIFGGGLFITILSLAVLSSLVGLVWTAIIVSVSVVVGVGAAYIDHATEER